MFSSEEELSRLIDKKRRNKEKLTYEEFKFIVLMNDEVAFLYNGSEYEIVHDGLVYVYKNTYEKNKLVSSIVIGQFVSPKELLENLKIENKSLKEFWDKATFNSYFQHK